MPNVAILTTAAPTVPPLTGVVDGWPQEEHAIRVNIAGAPVEDGVEVTDHSVLSSEQVTLTGWVSDWRGGNRTPAQAWAEIRRMAREREPIRLVTEWGIYPEMLIWEADAPKTNRGMRFTLKLLWINRIGLVDENLPPEQVSGPAEDRTGEVPRGRVALPPIPPIDPPDATLVDG